jgi:glycosyltransferase involved in cell wall biosynthesis
MVAYCYRPKTYLGWRRGIKGHEDFIDAIAMLRSRGVDVVGVIAGGAGPGAENYFQRIQHYAKKKTPQGIVFLGHRDDVPEVYADLDVAAHPSLSENLGGAAESLLYGSPTVTTSVGGFPDLVQQNRTGLMVPPRAPHALADAIEWLLRHPRDAAEMLAAGRRRVEEILDVRETAKRVRDVYTQLQASRKLSHSIQ